LASGAEAGRAQKRVPVAVVHGLSGLDLTLEDRDRNLEKPTASELSIELLDLHLSGEPEGSLELEKWRMA
jgi:hypothetical protein